MPSGPYHWQEEAAFTGGQGEIRFGTASDGSEVALKVASPSANAKAALRREAEVLRALAAADVSGVVTLIEEVDLGGRPALVLPRYAGTLRDWIDGILSEPDAGTLEHVLVRCGALATALAGVHAVTLEDGGALVHRDVKPENVLMDAEGNVFLADFGGALAVDGLAAVEMGLFGTPMWAPFDQILPGLAIPDPTWDTYALCVILYACVTGARPAYQADPRELLSERGLRVWQVAKRAIHASGDHQRTLRAEFAAERQGTSADDLVSMTGRSALNSADRRVLMEGVQALADLAGVDADSTTRLQRGLWNVLVRGLSPVSHPSPPNRYRDASELADDLDDLHRLAFRTTNRIDPLAGPAPGPDVAFDDGPPTRVTESGLPLFVLAASLVAVVVVGIAATALLGAWSRPAPVVDIPARTVTLDGLEVRVPGFSVDRTEVTRGQWVRCVDAGACALVPEPGDDDLPVHGMTFDDADAYCAFTGGRLLSEAEWHALAGTQLYPWGEAAPTCDHAVAQGCGDALQPAGSARAGATPDGVTDLAGSVWEWTRVGKGGDRGVLLGGSLDSPASELGVRARLLPPQGVAPHWAGVRCAYGGASAP